MKKETKKTLWIACSGLDGSGKTTLVDNLFTWFTEEKGLSVYRDRLPHDKHIVNTLLDASHDKYTDRLLFAVDNRIFGTKLRDILKSGEYDIVLTQRCFLDSFVHGAVQGYSYSWIEDLNRTAELPRTDVIIHMVAEARTAYSRIRNDPDADKFEYPAYIRKQEVETRRAYAECETGNNIDLDPFNTAHHFAIDSTRKTTEEVFEIAKTQLTNLGIV